MSSAEAQVVYNQAPFSEPDEAQETFARQFDLTRPEQAMYSYQRIMHQHTKQQYEMAAASSRRRSSPRDIDMVSLSSERSHGSVSSTAS